MRYLGLPLVSSSQELHDDNVRFGHLQDTVHLYWDYFLFVILSIDVCRKSVQM